MLGHKRCVVSPCFVLDHSFWRNPAAMCEVTWPWPLYIAIIPGIDIGFSLGQMDSLPQESGFWIKTLEEWPPSADCEHGGKERAGLLRKEKGRVAQREKWDSNQEERPPGSSCVELLVPDPREAFLCLSPRDLLGSFNASGILWRKSDRIQTNLSKKWELLIYIPEVDKRR